VPTWCGTMKIDAALSARAESGETFKVHYLTTCVTRYI
jgi:hypothetical protein